jgi:hypothetical protein
MNVLSPWCYKHLCRSAIGTAGRKPLAKHITICHSDSLNSVRQQHAVEASFVSRLGLDLNPFVPEFSFKF